MIIHTSRSFGSGFRDDVFKGIRGLGILLSSPEKVGTEIRFITGGGVSGE